MEVQVCCRLITALIRPIGLVENDIPGTTGVAVAIMVCRPKRNRRTVARRINVTSQLQYPWNFMPMEESQIHRGSRLGHCAESGMDQTRVIVPLTWLLCWSRASEFVQFQIRRDKFGFHLLPTLIFSAGVRWMSVGCTWWDTVFQWSQALSLSSRHPIKSSLRRSRAEHRP